MAQNSEVKDGTAFDDVNIKILTWAFIVAWMGGYAFFRLAYSHPKAAAEMFHSVWAMRFVSLAFLIGWLITAGSTIIHALRNGPFKQVTTHMALRYKRRFVYVLYFAILLEIVIWAINVFLD